MNINRPRLALYIGATDPNEPILTLLADYALEFLNRETHRYFGSPVEREEYLQGSGTHRLFLADAPIGDPVVKEYWQGAEEDTVTDFATRGRLLTRLEGKQWGRRYDYEITYTAGFHILPADVEQAVFDLVRWKYQALNSTTPGMVSEKLGDYSYTRGEVDGSGSSWVPMLNATINAYKRNPI